MRLNFCYGAPIFLNGRGICLLTSDIIGLEAGKQILPHNDNPTYNICCPYVIYGE